VPSKKPLCPPLDYCPRCVDWRSRYPGPPEYTPRVLPDDKRTLFHPALLLRRATMRGDTYERARAGPSSGTPTALTAVSLFVSRKCKLRLPSWALAARYPRPVVPRRSTIISQSRELAGSRRGSKTRRASAAPGIRDFLVSRARARPHKGSACCSRATAPFILRKANSCGARKIGSNRRRKDDRSSPSHRSEQLRRRRELAFRRESFSLFRGNVRRVSGKTGHAGTRNRVESSGAAAK